MEANGAPGDFIGVYVPSTPHLTSNPALTPTSTSDILAVAFIGNIG